jgi:signal transduction histidine kinase
MAMRAFRLRSIRWRLVASYMLLTLLTAGLVGALALSLVKRHAEQQEIDYLTANANAAARQAVTLMWPAPRLVALQQLAQTSAFLGNVRVRILDSERYVVADSGARNGPDTFMWVLPPDQVSLNPDDRDGPLIMSLVLGHHRPGNFPPGTRYMMVQRDDGPWGRRFIFVATGASTDSAAANDTPDQTTAGATSLPAAVNSGAPTGNADTNRSNRSISVPIGDATHTIGYVELSGAPNFGAETLSATAQSMLLAAIAASLVAGIVALFVGRGLTAPLNSLAHAANRMSAGDLSTRAPVRSNDETGQLAQQFNQMAERLQASFEQLEAERDTLRRFIADASHELRTPITALKTFNELLRTGASEDPSARAEFLAESQSQIERLEWITRNLLDLSRLDAGVTPLDMAECDAGEVLQSAAAPFRQLAQERNIALNIELPTPALTVCCDRARIEIALSNLLDNAIKFSIPGGHITAGVQHDSSSTGWWVQDDGPGIDATDLPHIFERFYRGKANGVRGSGLGLALVKSVVQAHGGQVHIESQPGQGSHFSLVLPAVEKPT